MNTDLTRRGLIAAAPAAASLLAAAPAFAATKAKGSQAIADADVAALLADPVRRARVLARVKGSCEQETVSIFYRLDIYGFTGDGNMEPYFTLNHLSVNEWTPLANDEYEAKTFECGAYTRFGTDEPLEYWKNPVTGENRKVWQFLGGPFSVITGANGMRVKGAELSPQPARLEAFGGMLFVNASASRKAPNPIDPKVYPDLSSGPISYWDTVSSNISHVADAFDESISAAPAVCQFQNMGSWHPWMGMGARPGRTIGRATGTKLKSLDEIPAGAMASLQKLTPEIFDRSSWTQMRLDIPEYLATQKK